MLVTFTVLLLILVIIIPWTIMSGVRDRGRADPGRGEEEVEDGTDEDHYPPNPTVEVFVSRRQEISVLTLEEYVVGVVAAEMPANFHLEALKAQAVLARTYAVAKLRQFGGSGTAASPEADISDNPDFDQAWIDSEQMRDRWGFLGYWLNRAKIEEAVEATRGLVVTHEGDLIEAVYHSTSGGRTEDASDVWGNAFPYLPSVPSPHEDHSPYFLTQHRFSWDRLAQLVGVSGALLAASSENPAIPAIEVTVLTGTGRVAQVTVGGREFSGRDIRGLLNLPSTWWEIEEDVDGVTFWVRGFGHGVGMSQYGADGMAEEGYSFREIISHYYPGCALRSLEEVTAVRR
ncbi:MAG: stage II sporulation protein D [Bacillota bacterium]